MEMMDNSHGRICSTGLSLGLCVVAPATATSAKRSNHRRPGDPCWPCISMASDAPPSLSLSLSSDDVHGEAAPLSSARSVVSRRASEEGEEDGGERKKLRLTREQSAMLEDRFKENSSLTPKQKQALAKQLNLQPRQVEVWFQNRRARTKLKQTAEDRGLLKKYFEMLTTENQRLQKELQELKALYNSPSQPPPPLFMEIPAAALAMCPSCQRMASAGAGPSMALKSVFN